MQQHNIVEGLTSNALNYLILPLISIDEYESKIDDRRVIVVGLYVNDYDPADDLSTFIDKSNLDILDTEISPAPTPNGHYVVFVEIRRNQEFPSILLDMLSEIENLCTVKKWEMKCPGQSEPILVTKESLEENLILNEDDIPNLPDEEEEEDKELNEAVNFWKNSVSDKIEIEKNTLRIYKNNEIFSYEILPLMPKGAMKLLESSSTSKLQSLLGSNYSVWNIDDNLVVEYNRECWTLKSLA